jgi:hypothetical protein
MLESLPESTLLPLRKVRLVISYLMIVTGRKCKYTVIPSTGVPDRDVMFTLYNDIGMYGKKEIPDQNLVDLGIKFHNVEDFVCERLAPHSGI